MEGATTREITALKCARAALYANALYLSRLPKCFQCVVTFRRGAYQTDKKTIKWPPDYEDVLLVSD
jgi:hypothetical protein